MSKSLKLNLILISIIVLGTVGIFGFRFVSSQSTTRSASGYAWSDNIGYISFSGNIVASTPDVPDVVPTCTPDSPLTQTLACPTGQTGSITQTRTSVCPGPVTSAWITMSDTCVTPATVPGAPTNVTAATGDSQATISFTAPASNGGSPITGYTITSSQGGITKTGLVSPITITGLTNGTSYSFTVTATNIIGIGPASSPISVIIGLKWSAEQGTVNWYTANATCAGYGWRLPTIGELLTALTNQRIEIGFQTNANYLSNSEVSSGVVEVGGYYSPGGVGSTIFSKACSVCSARCVYY